MGVEPISDTLHFGFKHRRNHSIPIYTLSFIMFNIFIDVYQPYDSSLLFFINAENLFLIRQFSEQTYTLSQQHADIYIDRTNLLQQDFKTIFLCFSTDPCISEIFSCVGIVVSVYRCIPPWVFKEAETKRSKVTKLFSNLRIFAILSSNLYG